MHNCPHCGLSIANQKSFRAGDLFITEDDSVYWMDQRVEMSLTVNRVAVAILRGNGRILTRDALLNIADLALDTDYRAIDASVVRARKAFRKIDPSFNYIRTTYKLGYELDVQSLLRNHRMVMPLAA